MVKTVTVSQRERSCLVHQQFTGDMVHIGFDQSFALFDC